MGVKDYDLNPDNNTQINGINIAEGCPPSGINNAIRQLMADVRENADEQDKKVEKKFPIEGGTITGGALRVAKNGVTGAGLDFDGISAFVGAINEDGTWGGLIACRTSKYSNNPEGIEIRTGRNFEGPAFILSKNGQLLWNSKNIAFRVNGVEADASGSVNLATVNAPNYGAGYQIGGEGNAPATGYLFFHFEGTEGTYYLNVGGQLIFNNVHISPSWTWSGLFPVALGTYWKVNGPGQFAALFPQL